MMNNVQLVCSNVEKCLLMGIISHTVTTSTTGLPVELNPLPHRNDWFSHVTSELKRSLKSYEDW